MLGFVLGWHISSKGLNSAEDAAAVVGDGFGGGALTVIVDCPGGVLKMTALVLVVGGCLIRIVELLVVVVSCSGGGGGFGI